MRRSLALGALLVALGSAVAPAAAAPSAPEIGPIPICDLDGHCDRRCWIGTYGVRCGV